MKVTVVPAQVTTVEDRIIGSLGFSQMMLLIVPVFASAGIFALLPPVMSPRPYKYSLMISLMVVCSLLAIRIKGKIVAFWLVTIIRYNIRPKFYVFNKNTSALREQYHARKTNVQDTDTARRPLKVISIPKLEIGKAVKVYDAINNPATKLRFETTKKGGLNVRLTKVEN